MAPPEGAPAVRVTVPVTVFGMTTLEALRLTALSAATGPAPLTVRLAVIVTPFYAAEIVTVPAETAVTVKVIVLYRQPAPPPLPEPTRPRYWHSH